MEPGGLVGQTLIGRFRIDRVLGKGGMATVFAAFDQKRGTPVAVKILKRELTRDKMVLKRFEREARAASHLRHPNVVEVVDWGIEGDEAFIAMELAQGVDLLKALAQERPMRQTRAVLVLAQVCAALALAHGKGIVHRDLKPENVLLVVEPTEPGGERAKVLDFGIAKILDAAKNPPTGSESGAYITTTALTRVGTIVGTPAYMSPEQCRGGEIDGRSDVYACGILLYQLVTGELPFTGETPLHMAMRHISSPPRRPSELRADLHEDLEKVILKALEKLPDKRHQTADELREELLAALMKLPDKNNLVLPSGYLPKSAADASAPRGEERPRTELVANETPQQIGGPLGLTPLRAVRLGGMSLQAADNPRGAEPQPSTTEPEQPRVPDDDDDEPRTFLMNPEPARPGAPVGSAEEPKTITRTQEPPRKEVAPRTPSGTVRAGKQAAPSASPAAPIVDVPAQKTLQSRAQEPVRPAIRLPKQTETGLTPTNPRASDRPPAPGNAASNAPAKADARDRSQQNNAASAERTATEPSSPKAASASPNVAAKPASNAVSPPAEADDDEPATFIRDPGPPPGANLPSNNDVPRKQPQAKTLVMADAAGPASTRASSPYALQAYAQQPYASQQAPAYGQSPGNAQQGAAQPQAAPSPSPPIPAQSSQQQPQSAYPQQSQGYGQQHAQQPYSQPNAYTQPTASQQADADADALRGLQSTARMASEEVDEASRGPRPANGPDPGIKSTVRMNTQETLAQAQAHAQRNAPVANGYPAKPAASNQLPSASWNNEPTDQTGKNEQDAAGRGLVSQVHGLSGTAGLVIGIGLGLGIAAGLLIAFLLLR